MWGVPETDTTRAIHDLAGSPVLEGPGEPCPEAWTILMKERDEQQGGDVVTTLLTWQPLRCSQTPGPSPGLLFLPDDPPSPPSSLHSPPATDLPIFHGPLQMPSVLQRLPGSWAQNSLFLPLAPGVHYLYVAVSHILLVFHVSCTCLSPPWTKSSLKVYLPQNIYFCTCHSPYCALTQASPKL